MKRWASRILTVACLLAIPLMIANFLRDPYIILVASYARHQAFAVGVSNKRVAFEFNRHSGADPGWAFSREHAMISRVAPGLVREYGWTDGPFLHARSLGFLWYRDGGYECFVLPLWYFLPILTAYPVLFVFKLVRARPRRIAATDCPACGYDLRAHKAGDKCPECGVMVEKEAVPHSKPIKGKPDKPPPQ